jgi:hypothetical protein
MEAAIYSLVSACVVVNIGKNSIYGVKSVGNCWERMHTVNFIIILETQNPRLKELIWLAAPINLFSLSVRWTSSLKICTFFLLHLATTTFFELLKCFLYNTYIVNSSSLFRIQITLPVRGRNRTSVSLITLLGLHLCNCWPITQLRADNSDDE